MPTYETTTWNERRLQHMEEGHSDDLPYIIGSLACISCSKYIEDLHFGIGVWFTARLSAASIDRSGTASYIE